MTKEETGNKQTKAKAKRKPTKAKAKAGEVAETSAEKAPVQADDAQPDAPIQEAAAEVTASEEVVMDSSPISIQVTKKLRKKLVEQAHEEGVSLEEYISEILAESVTLRAWEILERNAGMRSNQNRQNAQNPGNSNQQSGGGNRGNRGNQRGNKGGGRRGMSHSRYQNIMDDQAAFREYVRNQERKNGNR